MVVNAAYLIGTGGEAMILTALAAAAFDPEAATQAYLSTLNGAARAKSDAYFEGGYWLLLWGALVTVLVAWIELRFGWSAKWSGWAARVGKRRWLQPALYAFPFVLVTGLLTLPWTIYTDFLREHQYGLSNQSFAAWAGDALKALLVNLILIPPVLMGVYAVIRRSPKRWWLYGALVVSAFTLIGAVIAPVFIAPIFNSYKPMAAGPLRDQILAMAHAQHIPAENVYVFDASKQTKRISANVSGLGPTIRISLNDNLLNRTSPAEVKAVMGHEMGHYVLGHVWRGFLAITTVFLVLFLLLWWSAPRLLARYGQGWGVTEVSDPASLPLLVAIASVLFLVMTPVLNTIVRTQEAEADAFGLDAAREPDGFAAVSMKLSEYRKISPTPVEEFIFYDHPSGENRVRRSMQWKAQHLNEAP
ncbi:M48 family metallopeptidase [Sphingomonas tabacisoli]|uniref:M48 family metallopeptidase n=1 Tax=Sphingomonas tabacisoli TaxID=2249466 RepID=A0ABW4I416_9SPHN